MTQQFKTADKTVVTQVVTETVSPHRKTGVFKQTVSAKVTAIESFHATDVAVTASNPYIIHDTKKVIGISCPEPIKLRLSAAKITEGVMDEVFMSVTPQVKPDGSINIHLRDTSRDTPSVLAKVVNARTGEVLEIVLQQTATNHVYEFRVYLDQIAVMYGDNLAVVYEKLPDIYGIRGIVQATSQVVDEFSTQTGEFEVPSATPINDTLHIRVYDMDKSNEISAIVLNETTNDYSSVVLRETAADTGIFDAELQIVKGSGTSTATKLYAQEGHRLKLTYVDINNAANTLEGIHAYCVVAAPVNATHTVELEIDGLFYLNGSFEGQVSLIGKSEEPVRCELIYA